jgi:hypothetical protein
MNKLYEYIDRTQQNGLIDEVMINLYEKLLIRYIQNPFMTQFLIWMNTGNKLHVRKYIIKLLETKPYLLRPEIIFNSLPMTPIESSRTTHHSYTPCNSFSCVHSVSVPLYSIFKFIGQYTNNINDWNKCFEIVNWLKIDGPFMKPIEMEYLFSKNKNFVGLRNIQNPKTVLFDEDERFNGSIYYPNPSYNTEFNDFQRFMLDESVKLFQNDINDEIHMMIMINEMFNLSWNIPNSLADVRSHVEWVHDWFDHNININEVQLNKIIDFSTRVLGFV